MRTCGKHGELAIAVFVGAQSLYGGTVFVQREAGVEAAAVRQACSCQHWE